MEHGIVTLIPLLCVVVLSFATKRVIFSLVISTLVGTFILDGIKFPITWLDYIQETIAGGMLGYLLTMLALFGILIALFNVSGIVRDFALWLSKFANSRKKALLITYCLGWLIFVDDYLNNMAITTAMKSVCDKHKIPRTFLGYVINSTGAPVCILVPLSTWAVFYGGLFEEQGITANGSGMGAYISAIPYLFFGWAAVILMLFIIIGVIPMYGRSRKDNRIALKEGIVASAEETVDGKPIHAEAYDVDAVNDAKPWAFLIPMAVLIAVAFVFDVNILLGCMAGIVTQIIIILSQKRMKFKEILDEGFGGLLSMAPVCAMLTMGFTLAGINTHTGLTDYVVETLSPHLSGSFVPAVIFGVVCIYASCGGGFWDMSMIFFPIVIPLALATGADPIVTGAAIMCSAACGSATYVCSDNVNIVAKNLDIKPVYLSLATIPYSLTSYAFALIGFIIVGFIG